MVESIRQIHKRLLWFFVLFILISGVVGSWIVSTNLLFDAGFWIYGNIGKLVLLLLIFFSLQIRKKVKEIKVFPRRKIDKALIELSLLCIPTFLVLTSYLLGREELNIGLIILSHVLIIGSGASLFLGVFGMSTVNSFMIRFKDEVKVCLFLLPFLYIGIFQVWKLWPLFSGGVLSAVTFLLSLSFEVRTVEPYTIFVRKFGVEIAESCSGLDSLYMFSMLYLLIVANEWKRINKTKAILVYFPLAAGLYFINIMRVYVMVLIGALWSPDVAISLFHTYAGMVFFFIYFLVFFKYGYKWLRK